MTINLRVNDQFPDLALPNHQNEVTRLSHFTKPSLLDKHLGFLDGYPLILVFFRGFFCPRDQQQMRQLVEFQHELAVNFGKLVAVSADPPLVQAAFRAGLGAHWTFLSDEQRIVIKQINILDETEGEYAYRAQPYTLVLRPDLCIYSMYNGCTLPVARRMKNCDTTCVPSWKLAPITVTKHMTRRRCVKSAFPSKNGLMARHHWGQMVCQSHKGSYAGSTSMQALA